MAVEFIYGECARPEFGDMFGGWLLEHGGKTFLVDCGVGSGALDMVSRLKKRLSTRPLDYILLTHIHLDHSGGLGEIFKAWPKVQVVVHQKGLKHLVNPEKLWAGTVEVMGPEVSKVYARPGPLKEHSFIPHTEADLDGIEIYETPGHAPHHLSYGFGPVIFVGEAAGCPFLFEGRLHCRPATPPRYFPEITHNSIRHLLQLPEATAYCGHTHEPLPFHQVLRQSLAQLQLWDSIFLSPESTRNPSESLNDYQQRLTKMVISQDPELAFLKAFTGLGLWRELYFLGNSLQGFIDHYADRDLKSGEGGPA